MKPKKIKGRITNPNKPHTKNVKARLFEIQDYAVAPLCGVVSDSGKTAGAEWEGPRWSNLIHRKQQSSPKQTAGHLESTYSVAIDATFVLQTAPKFRKQTPQNPSNLCEPKP